MSWWTTARAVGASLGITERRVAPVGCALGRTIYRETRRASTLVNLHRRPRPLLPATVVRLQRWFPDLDLTTVRVRTRCRLPPNRFRDDGSVYAMTFGATIHWRGDLDETSPLHLVRLLHELVHVDQFRRYRSEDAFACAYGEGYLAGGGELPAHLLAPTAYHRNPLEAEAYRFDATFRDAAGRVVAARIDNPAR